MNIEVRPQLERRECGGIAWWTDPALHERGVLIAFSERSGGVSPSPYESLNLAGHVGDEPGNVDRNRDRFLNALGLSDARERLTTAEQVHGTRIRRVGASEAGAGAHADRGPAPIEGTDAMLTTDAGIPLMMLFADCVPIVLVAPGPAVSVVHAGWRGALAGLPGDAARALARTADRNEAELIAYVGPHIGACHYDFDEKMLSQFVNTFGTVARAESGHLDLAAVVAADLARSGVSSCRIALLGACTAEQTDRFFSYRAEGGLTGRHGLLACILS